MKQLKKVAFLASAVCVSSLSTAQEKKWNYGFHLGSDQYFASKPKPNAHNYRLEDTRSYKAGIFLERNLNEKESLLLGFNYNFYWLKSYSQ